VFSVALHFDHPLRFFLRREFREMPVVRRELREKTAVKDVIEACGVPHPEVDLIVWHSDESTSHSVDLAWPVERDATLAIHGVPAPAELLPDAPRLQQRQLSRFVADGHLGKLARNLRLLGIDTAYERDADDRRLLAIAAAEDRVLLTRDRRLLMHSVVRHGFCPRSDDPELQTREVLQRFGLSDETQALAPFTRCLQCNAPLTRAPLDEVRERLAGEPLTLRFYTEFRRCTGCAKIFWPGSHFQKLATTVARFTAV